jgi:cytoskeleton protein RodZ
MSAFGENLRREREMRGVSLEEISSATKISLRFLEAIEREDFSKLPGGIFSRSFIRSYAKYLGLDEERAVAEYQLAAHPQVDFDLHRMTAGNATAGRPASRTPLISTVVVIILLAGGYWLFRYSQRAAEAPTPPPPAVQVPANPAPSASAPANTPAPPPSAASSSAAAVPGAPPATQGAATAVTTSATPTAGAAPNPQAEPPASSNPTTPSRPPTSSTTASNSAAGSDLVLQVAATERAWVAVDADGKTVLQRVLNPQEVQTLKAHKSFDVTTGNAQAVILTLNGETLTPLGRHGEVKTVHLTRQDIKNPAP